jgi:phage N-6-adenine-methyltransferase
MKENSNIIYGRLAEATHISGYSLERAMSEFEWLLEDNRWKEVGTGYDNINDFLKTLNFSEFKIAIEQRKKIAQKLKELEASQRATANTLGVGVGTINRDIDENVPNGTLKENIYTNNKEVTDENVPFGTSSEDLLFTKNKPHVSNNSGENEWYTPSEYIESARNVMGSINLDPASSDKANKIVKAETIYTKEDDGLTKSWYGNIWLNPPYSQPLISHFSNKLIEELSNIKQACILTNNASETEWYQQLMLRCDAICFIKGRVKFIDLNGDATGAPLQGQTIMYFGENINEFDSEFSKYGIICMMKKTAVHTVIYSADDTSTTINKKEGQYKKNIKDKNFRNFQKVLFYFDSKFFNEKKWIDCYGKLIRIEGYSEDRILEIVKEFRSDGNWWKDSGNFETLLKLRRKDKEGIKFIDLFDKKLSLKNKNNGYSGKNTKPATEAELIGDRI